MFSETPLDALTGMWEWQGSFINCTKLSVNELECRYSKYLNNEVQRITYAGDGLKYIWRGGENNVEYTDRREMQLLNNNDLDSYNRKVLNWNDGQKWTELGNIYFRFYNLYCSYVFYLY